MSGRAASGGSKLVVPLARGAVAGAVGTAAMDLNQYVRHRLRGGKDPFWHFEFCAAESFDHAPAPAQIALMAVDVVLGREIPDRHVNLANNLVHWGYGVSWASILGLVTGRSRTRRWTAGVLYGTVVFLSGSIILPTLDVYKPLWDQDPSSIRRDWVDHLLYGIATSATLGTLVRRER